MAYHLASPVLRIIPADAGSTDTDITVRIYNEDHPRGCGEHGVGVQDRDRHRGSSPRMRGARLHQGPEHLHRGIIPADAGSTLRNPCNPNNTIDWISDF